MKHLEWYLQFLGNLAQNGVLLLGYSDIVEWPSNIIPSLHKTGVLVPTQNTSHIKCPGCHESCYVEPDVYTLPDGNCHVQTLCRQQGCRIDIDAELLNQYEIIPDKLKQLGYWVEDNIAKHSDSRYAYEWLGDTWRLVFDGQETFIDDKKGARLLAILLCNPNKNIYCLDLQAQERSNPIIKANEFEDVVADPEAIKAYKEKLSECREELEDAEHCNDYGRIDSARQQVDFITEHLLKLEGFNGRTRTFSTNAEKARKSVRKNISDLIKSQAMSRLPAVQQHLTNSISYGKFICYAPEKEIDWNVKKNF